MSGNISTDTIDTGTFIYKRTRNLLEGNKGYIYSRKNNKTGKKVKISKKIFDSEIKEAWADYKKKKLEEREKKIKVELITQIDLEKTEPGVEPVGLVFNKGVKKLTVANGQLKIEYRQVEKEEIQWLKLPTDKLHKITIEFY